MGISCKYFFLLAYQGSVQPLYETIDIITLTALSKHEKQRHGWGISRWWLFDIQRFKTVYLEILGEINFTLSCKTMWQILLKEYIFAKLKGLLLSTSFVECELLQKCAY